MFTGFSTGNFGEVLNKVNMTVWFSLIILVQMVCQVESAYNKKTPLEEGFRVKDRVRTGDLWIHKPAL